MQGRCAGCGRVDKRAADTQEHTRYCPDYRRLFHEYPERALEPSLEYIRWSAAERGEQREERKQAVVEEADQRRADQQQRWATPPDILE